jgi:porphobilinogen synthase
MDQKLTLRRLRQNPWIRELVRETRVSLEQLIQPLFVVEGLSAPEPVAGLPGVYRETSESLLRGMERDLKAGVRKFLLFVIPAKKSLHTFNADFATEIIASIRKYFGNNLFLMVDVCLCSYTEHGHCGIMNRDQTGIENASSVRQLASLALAYAQAGADAVAPSDMMDGRVHAIREALDQDSATESTILLSYSVKFQSQFYGPFRLAAESSPGGGLKDRSTYQLDPASFRGARLSALRDAQEGADILMVKPGLPYLDVLFRLSSEISKPWAVYEVSGEFAALQCLAEKNLMDAASGHLEAWNAFIRAGATMVITYGARLAQGYLEK